LITGAAGFVGRHLWQALTKEGAEVIAADLNPARLAGVARIVALDITREEQVRQLVLEKRPDWIVHLAAWSRVGTSFAQPREVWRVNVAGTRNVLSAARESKRARVLVVSSAEVYGNRAQQPVPELPWRELKPLTPYGRSKLAAEKIAMVEYADLAICARPFPHLGPGQALGFVVPDFVSQIVEVERGKAKPVLRVGNLEVRRDWLDVRDVVQAYVLLLRKGRLGEVYNICTGRAYALKELLQQLLALARVRIRVEKDPARIRPVDVPVLVGSPRKIERETGWKAERPLEQTLREVIEEWRQRLRVSAF
jgi:GDP-4-dehydro-6-deoxy-D-mannose reductase